LRLSAVSGTGRRRRATGQAGSAFYNFMGNPQGYLWATLNSLMI